MASQSAERRPSSGRLNTAYWLLLTVLLGLPLITPLLRWSSVACTHDGHLHYHRVAALAHAWENGIYLTRWLPDLAFGYGYPFFVYREPAPLYAVLLPFLAGLPLPAASNLFYAVTILSCGIFMFLWARDLFGPRAALVSAVAYMAAPYVLVDALIRGNAPESLALPLFPFLLWVGRRWVLRGSVPAFIAGVLGLALLSLGHNISTFIFAPTLLIYLLALGVLAHSASRHDQAQGLSPAPPLPRPPVFRRAFLFILLGLGLAFFYTGGALLEMDQVTLEMSTTTRNNDWRYNFATAGEILGPVAPEDPALVNPPLLFRLGWAPLALAALGLTGLLWIKGDDRRAREQRLHIWLMIAAVAVYLFMALPLSGPVWEALPLIDFVQFPWRFVGRAALPVALLSGVPFFYFDRRPPTNDHQPTATNRGDSRRPTTGHWSLFVRRWSPLFLTAAAIGLIILEAVPNLYPRLCAEEPFPTIQTVHNYERITGLVGVDPEGSYFPRTVAQRPAGSALEVDYVAGNTPQRFDPAVLPAGATIRDVVYGRYGVTLNVDSPEPFTARYLSFAFPGWSAHIDGEPVAITAEDPTGLITFEVPAGAHAIAVEWGTTRLRMALVALSILSALGVAAVVVWARRRQTSDDPGRPAARPRRDELVVLLLLAAGLLTLKVYADRHETPLRQSAAPPVANVTTLQAGEMRLDGFNLSRDPVAAGEAFDIDMAWTATAAPPVDYQSEIALIGPDGLAWSVKGSERPRVYEDAAPSRLWSPGEWGWDSREVQVLSGAPPGVYDLVVTLFDKRTLAPASWVDASNGSAIGPAALIGQIEIANPDDPPLFDAQYPVQNEFPDLGLRLLGYNQDRIETAPGEPVLMTLFWECADPMSCEEFSLRLVDETGAAVAEWRLPVIRDGFAAGDWPEHGRLRAQHIVQLPAGLPTGRYRFVLEDEPLGEMAVTAPEREFTPPALAQSIDTLFTTAGGAPVATLVGIAGETAVLPCSPAPGLPCSVPLIWRAEAETATDYHVFVHLVDGAGNILAQSDAVPAGWTRPTTGWLPGEFITDTHALNIPAELPTGPLSLRVGLYDAETGHRLQAAGADYVAIPLAVEP